MISLDQWRATIGCFASCRMPKSCMFIKCRSCVSHECVMCVIIVYASIIGMLLIVSGNVELNPGPNKKCPKCECSVGPRTKKCECGHVFIKFRSYAGVCLDMLEKRLVMRKVRAHESECESVKRKIFDNLSKSRKRMLESDNETLCRQESDQLAKKRKRLYETEDDALCRRESNNKKG